MSFERILPFVLFFASFIVFFLSSNGNTPYNYFTRLADAFLHGRLYTLEAPSWLTELIPAGDGRWYVPYSPMPALVAVPFVFLFGSEFPQQIIAHVLASGSVVISYFIARFFAPQKLKLHLWIVIIVSVGTIMWYEAATGSSWFLGQITCVFFLFLAIFLSLKGRALWAGVALSACYLSRVHSLFAIPVLLYLLIHNSHSKKKAVLLFLLGLAVGGVFSAWYNMVRFGVPWDKGYLLIPGVLDEPWFTHGIENIVYIPRNLQTVFWSFPLISDSVPYIKPSWNGLAIWITTPAFIFALFAPLKNRLTQILWISIICMFLFVLAHGSNGFAQFGYRFAIDFYPLLIMLTIFGLQRTREPKIAWVLLVIGVIVNLWGVLWINKFDWVGF